MGMAEKTEVLDGPDSATGACAADAPVSPVASGTPMARLQVIAKMLTEGLDISAEGASIRATLYQDSVILSHPLCLLIACVHCGKLKEGHSINDGDMEPREFDHLTACIHALPRCTCNGKALKEELVQAVLKRLTRDMRLSTGPLTTSAYREGRREG